MPIGDVSLLFIFFTLLFLLIPIIGNQISDIYFGKQTPLHPLFGWLERTSYAIAKISPEKEMTWIEYGKALVAFNAIGLLFLFFIQIGQFLLPLNPEKFPGIRWDTALNTAISFTTNTNWQSYAGETSLSYFTQMVGLTVQNFLSAATGLCALLVLTRGIIYKTSNTVGNFWADLVKGVVYLLLPLAIILSLILISEGVIQTFSPYVELTTLENTKQTIPLGPVASQVAIKQLGTNGGGFFNTNSAHPFENPTFFTNFLEQLAILLIPASCVYAYGKTVGSIKHAWILTFVMFFLTLAGLAISFFSEWWMHPHFEGVETRFGLGKTLLWSVTTTASANGSVNGMLSSLSPLTGGVALLNMMLGECLFGGAGVGLCSMIMYIFLTVFLSGLMVGRTPEYMGKKIEKEEMRYVMLAILLPPAMILIGTSFSCLLSGPLSSISNKGPHGLTEIAYAISSAAANNGSGFASLQADTPYFNLLLGAIMILGRVSIVLPSLAIGGFLAKKKAIPPSIGTFSTSTPLFVGLLTAIILLVGALTFLPLLSLGPIVEHLLMIEGKTF